MKHSARSWLALGGALVAGVAASACCVLPVLLISLGVTGAWMAQLRVLEPFRPFLLGGAWLLWGGTLYRAWARPQTCEVDGACAPRSYRIYWVSGLILLLITLSPWWVGRLVSGV